MYSQKKEWHMFQSESSVLMMRPPETLTHILNLFMNHFHSRVMSTTENTKIKIALHYHL